MSILSTLSTDDSIVVEKDSLGGGGPLESGLYNMTVEVAYVTKSQGGAMGLVLHLKTDTGREHRETVWMTSGTAKGGKNYYERDGQKHYLPGFIVANHLALLAAGKEITSLDTETKVIKAYSYEAGAEVPTQVEMVTDLLGKEVIAGIIKQVVNKNVKTDDGYVPSEETREEAYIDKLFRLRDRMTVAEIRAEDAEATFIDRWNAKWEGQVRDNTKKAAGNAGVPRAAAAASQATKKPTTSLFA